LQFYKQVLSREIKAQKQAKKNDKL
jgi:hypothetical protein